MSVFDKIKQQTSNPKFKQVAGLFSVNIIGLPISILISIILTRQLGAEGYGNYKYIFSIFNFATLLLSIGFVQAANRMFVLNKEKEKTKELYGALIIIILLISVLMITVLMLYSKIDNNLQEKGIEKIFLLIVPFSPAILTYRFLETVFMADSKIRNLGIIRILPKTSFLLVLISILLFFKLEVQKVLVISILNLSIQSLIYISIIIKNQFSFKNLTSSLRSLLSFNKTYGFNVYLGALFGVGFAELSNILISYFGYDNTGVGFYSLALTISMPLTFIPNTIATTHYKSFAGSKNISKKLVQLTLLISSLSLIGLLLLVKPFIFILYGADFMEVIPLVYIVSFGIIMHGFGDFYNKFLGANGQGKTMRNSAFIVGIIMFLSNIILIPRFETTGAAISKILASSTYFLLMYAAYLSFIRKK